MRIVKKLNSMEKNLGMFLRVGKVAALQNDEKQISRPEAIVRTMGFREWKQQDRH